MAFKPSELTNPFLKTYLDYVEHTEAPRIMHVWSALAVASAAMQRHLYMDLGIGRTYANLYVWLVGPPATKKSTAIRFATAILKQSTEVRFAPDDTGGQRQGLIAAMLSNDEVQAGTESAENLSPEAILQTQVSINAINRHVLFVEARELGSFLGQHSLDLTRFLIKVYDGDDYDYQLKSTQMTLTDTLLIKLAATTSTDISALLPPEVIGQGFMSRCILVHAAHKEKSIPPTKARLLRELEPSLCRVLSLIFNSMHGSMSFTAASEKFYDVIYSMECKIQDTRFIYYAERRQIHILKTAMVLAAARGSMIVDEQDLQEALYILAETELGMPDALGEFGLTAVSIARHKMLEYIRSVKEPISIKHLYIMMSKDMKSTDFEMSINTLINGGKITKLDTPTGAHVVFNDALQKTLKTMSDEALDLILGVESPKVEEFDPLMIPFNNINPIFDVNEDGLLKFH